MGKYAIRRVLLFIPTLLLATVMVFALFWIVPGDPALTILGGGEGDELARYGLTRTSPAIAAEAGP